MKKILISTMPDDQHAIIVKMALAAKGHQATQWYTADFPSLQTHSFSFSQNKIVWESRGPEFCVNKEDEFDVVWWRRPRMPVMPDFVHPDDLNNANRENGELFKIFGNVIAPKAFWVNQAVAARQACCKLLQLRIAKQSGLNIPETLISNDPRKIKNFLLTNSINNTVYKPLFPVLWKSDEETRVTYTREINLSMLPHDHLLQSTAGIFQKKIDKAYELRVNFLGDCCIAAKIKSQNHPKGKIDWRRIPGNELLVDEYDLPVEIYQKCRSFMKKLNLVFGCFDFIVTPDGDYYFLEINEQGQFLWIEDINPDIKILDAFTEFLISGTKDFTWKKTSSSLSIANHYNEMRSAKERAIKIHKAPTPLY